jgi:amino acid transporter
MSVQRLKRVLVGRPIPTSLDQHERLSRVTGLAVFASDALSSVAYATEAILLILVAAGTAALGVSLPIAFGIALLVAIVVTSFRQSILAYPKGGGAYVVTRENLGRYPSLVAGAALLIDYVLTVAVSVAAGIDAITSAIPSLLPYRVALCVTGVVVIALVNLRGVRESGRLFAAPTYLFVGAYLSMIGWGLVQWLRGEVGPIPPPAGGHPATEALTVFLALRAFASGCAALTGIEAVSDGVPAFRPPEAQNARQVLAVLGLILIVLFVGITFLAYAFHVTPAPGETTNSQLARHVFGLSPFYYLVQGVTTLILVLAANTSFADFPRVASFLARDGFVPRQFANRGDRLAYSNGILILTVLSVALLVVFRGETHALIPLYAVGVFLSFTLKQGSMVRYWLRRRGQPGWASGVSVQAVGATVTGLVMVVIAVTKFTHGAWIVVVLIPMLVVAFVTVRRHYDQVARQLSIDGAEGVEPPLTGHTVLVLVGDVHRGVLRALRYARALSENARGVYVEITPEQTRRVEERWSRFASGMALVVLRSPYRSVAGPLLEYLDLLQRQAPDHLITIILPEFIPARWWQHLLHNQTALLIKGALLFRKGVIVTNVPYHLEQ